MSRSVRARLPEGSGGGLIGEGARVNDVIELYHDVEKILASAASLGNRLQLLALFLSVLTSGSLWLLLSKTVPQATLWFGAIASTLATGIALYLKSSGINQVRTKALVVFRDLGQFLAEVRASKNMPEEHYWSKYKEFESRVIDLRYGRHDQD